MRCKGITRIGKQCSVTSSSNWTDDHGAYAKAHPDEAGGFGNWRATQNLHGSSPRDGLVADSTGLERFIGIITRCLAGPNGGLDLYILLVCDKLV